CQQGHDYPWTF
nr:immunoglobulin light chain junction region [Macaca mulatta]